MDDLTRHLAAAREWSPFPKQAGQLRWPILLASFWVDVRMHPHGASSSALQVHDLRMTYGIQLGQNNRQECLKEHVTSSLNAQRAPYGIFPMALGLGRRTSNYCGTCRLPRMLSVGQCCPAALRGSHSWCVSWPSFSHAESICMLRSPRCPVASAAAARLPLEMTLCKVNMS